MSGFIFLCGFMGSGKSTVGPPLAKALGIDYVDTDALIVKASGKTIPEIFRELGEPAFRKFEAEVIAGLKERSPAVVSLGGGSLLDPKSFETVKGLGTLVYLKARTETLVERLVDSLPTRPLLTGTTPQGLRVKLETMLPEREPLYAQAALQTDTDGRQPAEIADDILRQLRVK